MLCFFGGTGLATCGFLVEKIHHDHPAGAAQKTGGEFVRLLPSPTPSTQPHGN